MSAQPHLRLLWLSLSLSVMLIALAGCEDPEPADPPVPPPLPLPDLSILAACQDGEDNDLDELIDFPEDPGCMSPSDNNEAEMRPLTPCEDQRDNDNDGLVDFDDPSCVVSEGASEDAPEPEPECSNGVDDDEDGYVDFPADESCLDPSGDDESLEPPEWACNNRRDDDADGLIDYPFDPGCASPRDDDERDNIEASMIAQCNDGIDNDQDGYTDLADAECNTPTDARERRLEDEGVALCSNGLDDDEDGLVDAWEDPGCIGPGGASEVDGESLPACADGLDNDGDGYLDFPEEPGCASLGDQDELDPTTTPACLDGEDNDGDGLIDYPQDTGCDHAADTDERGACINAAAVLELSSGEIYRGSSLQGRFERSGSCGGRGAPEVTALYQVRRRLRSVTFSTRGLDGSQEGWETTLYARRRCDAPQLEVACAREAIDGVASNELTIDDPPLGPLYLIIDGASGRGGDFELSVVETPIEACQNQLDDDGDGFIDFPADPGCVSADDRDEQSPDPLPACADQADNDGDGLIDYPEDIGCRAAFDGDELDECGQGVPVYPLSSPPSVEQGNSTREGVSSESVGSCGGLGIEKVIRYDNPSHARLTFTLSRLDGVAEEAFLYARAYSCLSEVEELGCASRVIGGPPLEDEDQGEDQDEDQDEGRGELGPFDPDPLHGASMTLTLSSAPQGPIYLFIDHDLEGFPYRLITQRIPLTPRCSDEVDNDGDGLIDAGDDGCEGPEDESERDPEMPPICSDGRDNDLDGWTDYPLDLGCAYRGGASEADPEIPPRCSNGIDDNGDGYTDFPFDIGCAARGDDSEANLPEPPECSNLLDDDEDGFVDFPQDPGCVARGDLDEVDPARTPQCADGVDNDRNGQADYPFDPGCYARGDVREHPPEALPQCSDGVDNDQDGYTDLPYDPGCEASGDESEIDPVITPECANGVDDDSNGRVDWPDDPGCLMRADPREDAEGPLAPRCHDGVDNDDDGFTDLLDLDCSSRFDTTEDAPALGEIRWPVELLECADEIDNDGDGLIDWPADPGCAALGASCERGGYRRCAPDITRLNEGVCVDLLSDPLHCGACGHECESACEEGLCVGEPRPLRARLMYCGSSIRPVQQFLTGPLADSEMIISAGCDPDDSVQALLVTRTGGSGVLLNRSSIQGYLNRGGQVITERGVSDQVVSALFNIPVVEGSLFGDCGANIQPHTLSRPQDPLWSLTPHAPPPEGALGCGYDLSAFPGLIRLGGWDAQSVSLGYLEYGQGRVWLVESNWRDPRQEMTEQSLELMAAMIAGGGKPARSPALPECMDLYDNDHDGLIDLFDHDCQSARDVTEWSPVSPDEDVTPECSDGLDNDADQLVDFPFDPECESAGDLDESTDQAPEGESFDIGEPVPVAECADGLDNDGDGDIDWPEDASCHGRGARSESSPTTLTPCQNGQDDDQDGRIDFPADPECLAKSWPSELSLERSRFVSQGVIIDRGRGAGRQAPIRSGCQNGADDDGDGLIDFPADPECLTPRDPSEQGASSTLSLEERLAGFTAPLPECLDGRDNDGDGDVDLADVSCESARDQGPESGDDDPGAPLPECGDSTDNDEDLAIDWPEDVDCLARGARAEERRCETLGFTSLEDEVSLTFNPVTSEAIEVQQWSQVSDLISCADPTRSGQVYRFTLAELSAVELSFAPYVNIGEMGAARVAVSLSRGCGDDAQLIVCETLDLNSAQRAISVSDLPPGDYRVTVSAATPLVWESRAEPIELPEDPRGYQPLDDITSICWRDGGEDSFDCMGRVEVSWRGAAIPLDVSLGTHTLQLNDHYAIRYASERPHPNIWRIRYWSLGTLAEEDSEDDAEENAVSLRVFGNLGLDQNTIPIPHFAEIAGASLPYTWFVDDLDEVDKPPVLLLVAPRDETELSALRATTIGDQTEVVITAPQLPLTTYLTTSYLPRETLISAIRADLDVYEGADLPALTPDEVMLELNISPTEE